MAETKQLTKKPVKTKIEKLVTTINNASSKEYTLEEVTTEMIISIAKTIQTATEKASKEIASRKQYELGKLFNAASIAAKSKNSKVKIKDIQKALNMPPRTWENSVRYFNTHEDFKNILSLEDASTRVFPNLTISNKLLGKDSEDRFNNWQNLLDFREEPTSTDLALFNTSAKYINKNAPWTVTADEVRTRIDELATIAISATTTNTTTNTGSKPATKTTPTITAWDKLSIVEKTNQKWIYHFEHTEYDSAQYFIENRKLELNYHIPSMILEQTDKLDHAHWKTMYRKGAKIFHPDVGGENHEMAMWKAIAELVDDAYIIKEKNLLRKEHFEQKDIVDKRDESIYKEWFNKE